MWWQGLYFHYSKNSCLISRPWFMLDTAMVPSFSDYNPDVICVAGINYFSERPLSFRLIVLINQKLTYYRQNDCSPSVPGPCGVDCLLTEPSYWVWNGQVVDVQLHLCVDVIALLIDVPCRLLYCRFSLRELSCFAFWFTITIQLWVGSY